MKKLIILIAACFYGFFSLGQKSPLNDYPRKTIFYKHLIEKEVLCAKIRVSYISLDSIENKILGLPLTRLKDKEHKNLYELLISAVKNRSLIAYKTLSSENYKSRLRDTISFDLIKERMGISANKSNINYNADEIREYVIEELLFYGQNKEVIQNRIIGIAPVRHYYRYKDSPYMSKKIVFYVAYNNRLKLLLSNKKLYKKRRSYDDYFMNKQYRSEIFVYNTDCNRIEMDTVTKSVYPINLSLAFDKAQKYIEVNHNKKLCTKVYEKSKQDINLSKFKHIDEAEVKRVEVVYNFLDLREYKNKALHFPQVPQYFNHSFSLIDVLLSNIQSSDWEKRISIKQTLKAFSPLDTSLLYLSLEIPNWDYVKKCFNYVGGEISSFQIEGYILKELYFYDSDNELLQRVPIALCPKRVYNYNYELAEQDIYFTESLFWINYDKNTRYLLSKYYVYNNKIDKEYTFDEYFIQKRYKGLELNRLKVNKKEALSFYYKNYE